MDALTQGRLIALAIVLFFVAFWLVGRARDRRRQARFAALARSVGREVVREGEFLSRFPVEVEGRTFDVRLQHLGGGMGSRSGPGWCVITAATLRGVSELHSAEVRPRARLVFGGEARDFGKDFQVIDAGYPLREGWLDDRVRGAILRFYELGLPAGPLLIEEGRLLHRGPFPVERLAGERLRDLLTRQAAVAAALERAL